MLTLPLAALREQQMGRRHDAHGAAWQAPCAPPGPPLEHMIDIPSRSPSENRSFETQKKQHARVKKMCFRLETRFFSSSIRNARGEAVLRW